MQERSFDGVWWLPSGPDRTVGGRLSFRREVGPRLEILGELLTSYERVASTGKIPIVLGSIAGTDVTLLDVNLGGASFSLGRRYSRQEYRPELAVVGAHLSSRDDLRSNRWEIRFSQLAEWLEVGGFTVEVSDESQADTQFLYRVTYSPVRLPAVHVPGATLTFAFATPVPLAPVRSLNLAETACVDVALVEEAHFDELRSGLMWQLQNFLTFATDRRNTVAAVFLKVAGATKPLELLYQSRFESDTPADQWTMLFSYSRVAERAQEVISRWFEIYEMFGPPLNSMFSVIYGNIRATDTRFLNVVQAAESYHRRMYTLTDAERAGHAARVERLLAVAPSEDVRWLSGKLAHAAEPFLNERLLGLFERLGSGFLQPMFRNRKDVKSGAWLIADWRNKLTHHEWHTDL